MIYPQKPLKLKVIFPRYKTSWVKLLLEAYGRVRRFTSHKYPLKRQAFRRMGFVNNLRKKWKWFSTPEYDDDGKLHRIYLYYHPHGALEYNITPFEKVVAGIYEYQTFEHSNIWDPSKAARWMGVKKSRVAKALERYLTERAHARVHSEKEEVKMIEQNDVHISDRDKETPFEGQGNPIQRDKETPRSSDFLLNLPMTPLAGYTHSEWETFVKEENTIYNTIDKKTYKEKLKTLGDNHTEEEIYLEEEAFKKATPIEAKTPLLSDNFLKDDNFEEGVNSHKKINLPQEIKDRCAKITSIEEIRRRFRKEI